MLSLLLGLITAQGEECTLLADGIVLSKYYLDNCTACVRFNPIYEEIKSHAARNQLNIKFREVECGSCDCGNVSKFPTLEITNDKEVKGTSVGYKDYLSFTKWLTDTLLLDKGAFGEHISHEEGEVKTLKAPDFLTGFDGQWLILFYDNPKSTKRAIFKELAKVFKNKLTIAEVAERDAQSVLSRYNITTFPFVLAINNGTPVPYPGKLDLGSLSVFGEKLYKPSFDEIKYTDLKNITKDLRNGEPIFVVLYKNYEVASYYFNELAQQFKFKATIYRSSDPAMFTAAGHHPKDTGDFTSGETDHSQMAYLTVYKNGSFFNTTAKPSETNEVIQWIFHTHFPHVTSVNNDNFYTVFHGIKPVVLLLTSNEEYVDQFNKLSATWHLGAASSNIIFATLDTVEYPLFKSEVVKYVKEPGVVFYDPVAVKWFHREVKFTPDNFNKTVMKMIDSYFSNKLPQYTQKKKRTNVYVIIGIVIAACAFGYKLARTIRSKSE